MTDMERIVEAVAQGMWDRRCVPESEINPANTWDKAHPIARDIFLQQAYAAIKALCSEMAKGVPEELCDAAISATGINAWTNRAAVQAAFARLAEGIGE